MGRASKDKRDIYYRKAKEEGYRARSAYKLLQIHEDYNILSPTAVQYGAVDLCAAPGSWSQVLSTILSSPPPTTNDNHNNHNNMENDNDVEQQSNHTTRYIPPPVIAVDLQEMAPIPHVTILQGDITRTATAQQILDLLAAANAKRRKQNNNNNNNNDDDHNHNSLDADNKASIVVCDGAPDVTGMHELDEYLQHQLLLAALLITTCVLRPGGTFVTKMFRGPNTPFLIHKSELFFEEVRVVKPKSSRNASVESFLLCQKFRLPQGYVPRLHVSLPAEHHHRRHQKEVENEEAEEGQDVLLRVQGGSHLTADADVFCLKKSASLHENAPTAAIEALMVPFLSCGDLSGFDSDMCYDRTTNNNNNNNISNNSASDKKRGVLPPVQPPLQAPYLPPRQQNEVKVKDASTTSPTESPSKKMKQ